MILIALAAATSLGLAPSPPKPASVADTTQPTTAHGVTDAADFGFSPVQTGTENTKSLQRAVDQAGTVVVSRPGKMQLVGNAVRGKQIVLKTTGSIEPSSKFLAAVDAGGGTITVDSDLRGLDK